MNNFVSVIIPAYNNAPYIEECINSVLNQTYKNFEVLVIDDGSTDNTREVLSKIADSRIKYIYQKNQGSSEARNSGLRLAAGKYIAFLDSDDLWLSHKLEKQIKFMEANPEIGICGGFFLTFGAIQNQVWGVSCKHEDIMPFCLFDSPVYQSTVVIKRELINKYNLFYDKDLKSSVDYDFFRRLVEHTKAYNFPEVFAKYRIHHKQMSTSANPLNAQRNRLLVLKSLDLSPTEDEIAIHQAFSLRVFEENKTFYKKVNLWLAKIIAANKIKKKYNESNLNNVIVQRWLSVIGATKEKPLEAIIYYFQAPVPMYLKITKFLNHCLIYISKFLLKIVASSKS